MAEISVSGYVNRPETKTSKSGKAYSTFTLSSKQKNGKNADGTEKAATRVFYDCTNFTESSPPEDGSYVSAKGWFKVREYLNKTIGAPGKSFEINVQELTVSPPRGDASEPRASAATSKPAAKEPWED